MPRNCFFASVVLLGSLVVAGCGVFTSSTLVSSGVQGSGISSTEAREIGDFSSIEIRGSGTLKISFADKPAVTVTADDNILPLLDTRIEGDRLILQPSESISPKTELVYEVTATALSKIGAAGAVGVELSGFSGDSLELDLAGACRITGSGTAASLNLKAAGATHSDLAALIVENADVSLTGAGSATVHATKSFHGSAAGAASITCSGSPADVKKTTAGVATVTVN